MPEDVTYIAGENVPNAWNCYPWDAQAYGRGVYEHEELARECAGEGALADNKRKADGDDVALPTDEKKRLREAAAPLASA